VCSVTGEQGPEHNAPRPFLLQPLFTSANLVEEKFSEVRLSHMTADRPELVRHTGAVDDQRGCAEG
jgi:hypothetical protein